MRGECDQAQLALRRVYVAAQRYGALARLEFEWHIAPEVRIEQWVSALVGGVTPGLAKQRHTAMQQLRGDDPETQAVRDAIHRYAPRSEIVLVTGETGVGKELVSRALHEESGLAAGPFVSVNCAALNESLLEAELFGVTQGAFTGAESDQEGLLGAAEGGVLFLDEIGDTSLRFQALVLRLLENGEYRRVDNDALHYARCRFIAATNADLERRVADGTFRADLWHRLQHLVISLPPLWQRGRDIEDLAHYYLSHYCPGASFTEDALVAVRHYRWPGNVRQMQHVLEKMVIDHPGQLAFAPEHLPERIRLNS